MIATKSLVRQWGNGLALKLTNVVANTAGLEAGTTVGITAQPGRIIIETSDKLPTLDEMLESFDPKRYGGEAMAFDVKAMTRP